MRIAPLLTLTLAAASQAAQIVVTEVTYTHSATTTSDSHYVINPLAGTPSNWVSPIDYSRGTAVVRLEVFTKPTTIPTRFQICFDGSPSYACTDQAPAYTTPGVYTWTTPFTSFFQYSQVNWSLGTRQIALILKDTSNGKPAPENVGATESAKYMPTRLRVTVTLVSPGGTYVPPATDAGVPTADAGVLDAGLRDAGTPDAGATVDAGAAEDAGVAEGDAGQDAGAPVEELDAGRVAPIDAGSSEPPMAAAPMDAEPAQGGCGCQSAPLGLLVFALTLLVRRREK